MCMLYAFLANQKFLCHLHFVNNPLRTPSVYWVYWLMNCHSVEYLGVLARVVHNTVLSLIKVNGFIKFGSISK